MPGYRMGSTGDNLMADLVRGKEFETPDPMGDDSRYDDWFNQAHAGQLASAEAMFSAAGRGGDLRGAQARGAGLRQTLGGMGEGGLAGRRAIMDTGQASWGAGQQAAEMGSQERLTAADAYMQAQSQRAAWEQARAAAWQERFQAQQEAMMGGDAAYWERKRREELATQQLVGSTVKAAGAGIAAGSKGDKGGGGDGGGYGQANYQ